MIYASVPDKVYTVYDPDSKPVDVSQRAPYSRQLTMGKNSIIIVNYSDPAWVLDGWEPDLVSFK